MSIVKDYIIVAGPTELRDALNALLEKTHQDVLFANKTHYLLYQLGTQQSLLKVDLRETPFAIWHYDLLMRSATDAVRRTVAQFLWEQGGMRVQQSAEASNFEQWYEKNFNNQWANDVSGKWRQQVDVTAIDMHQDKLARAFAALVNETKQKREHLPARRWGFFKPKATTMVNASDSFTVKLKRT